MKVCKDCKINKELNEYHKNLKMKDGLLNSCKECVNIKNRIYKELNKENAKNKRIIYYKDNKNKLNEYSKIGKS